MSEVFVLFLIRTKKQRHTHTPDQSSMSNIKRSFETYVLTYSMFIDHIEFMSVDFLWRRRKEKVIVAGDKREKEIYSLE